MYIYVSDITFTDLSPVPVMSAVKSNQIKQGDIKELEKNPKRATKKKILYITYFLLKAHNCYL